MSKDRYRDFRQPSSKSMSITDKQIGEWCFGREIGKGSFAIVYHGWHSSSVSDGVITVMITVTDIYSFISESKG